MHHRICLRLAEHRDMSILRDWRLGAKFAFRYQGPIEEQAHIGWFEGLLSDPSRYLYMLEVDGEAIGCVGLRQEVSHWEVFNVINGKRDSGSTRGVMRAGMQLAMSLAWMERQMPIYASVLAGNPAVHWYASLGFELEDANPEEVRLRWSR